MKYVEFEKSIDPLGDLIEESCGLWDVDYVFYAIVQNVVGNLTVIS